MRVRRWVQAALLLMLGLYFLDNVLSGRISLYVNERFVWLSWLATAILLIVGAILVVDLLREPREAAHNHAEHDHSDPDHHHEHEELHDHDHDHDHLHDHDHGHDHMHHAPSWPILSLVAVPLVLGLLIPAKPLGADAIGTSGVSTSFSSLQGGSSSSLTVAPTDRNVLDWVRAFNSSSNVEEFSGQQADLVGFVYRDVRFKDNTQMMVARFTISCCVADASAIGVIVQAPNAASFAQDSWVHVVGKFKVEDFDGQKTPILFVDAADNGSKVEATDQPKHPYLYP